MTSSWIDDEPGWRDVRLQLSRLKRRALARKVTVTALATLIATVVALRIGLKPPRFEASVSFRVAERTQHEDDFTQTKRRLKEYVYDGIFTPTRCIELIKKYNLFPDLFALDERMAAWSFKDAIAISVSQNTFLAEEETSGTRSARIRIVFTYRNADTAFEVAQALGKLVIEHERAVRQRLSEETARRAQANVSLLKEKLERLHEQQAKLSLSIERSPKALLQAASRVQLEQVVRLIKAVQHQLDKAQVKQMQDQLRAALEKRSMLLSFRQTDWARAPEPRLARSWRAVVTGVALLFLLWPIAAIAVATYDRRVYNVEDVRHLGLSALGHVPPFEGDSRGSARARCPQRPRK